MNRLAMPVEANPTKAGYSEALAYLQDAANALEEGFILWDADLKFVFCNQKYKEIALPPGHSGPRPGQDAITFGHEIFKTGFWDIPDGEDVYSFADGIGDFIRAYGQGLEIRRADGRVILASSNKTSLGGYVLTFLDITDKRRAEAAEKSRWDILNDVIGSLEEGFSLWDADFKLLMCNDKYMQMIAPYRDAPFEPGISGEEVCSETFRAGILEFPTDMDEQGFQQQWMAWAKSHGEPVEVSYKDGRTVLATSKYTNLGSVLITTVDVTEIKRAEQKRMETITDIIGSLEEGFSLWTTDLKFIMCNDKYMETLFPPGFPKLQPGDDAIELTYKNLKTGHIPVPDGVDLEAAATEVMDWAKSYGKNRETKLADGRTVVVSSNRTKLGGFLLTVRDITKELNSEQKARDMLFDAFQSLDEGLVLLDEEMRFIFANDAWQKMMFDRPDRIPPKPGDSALENFIALVKTGFYDIPSTMSEDDFIAWMMSEMAQHGKQVRYRATDGRYFVGSSHLTQFGGSLLFVRDVTEARRAEEKRLEAVTDAIQATDDALVLFDKDSKFVLANRAWLEGFFSDRDPPEQGADGLEMFHAVIEEGFYVVPDGLTEDAFFERCMRAFYGFEKNLELKTTDGRILIGSSHRTGLGGYLLSFRDVTETRRAEERLSESVIDALQSLSDGIALFDADFQYVVGNRRYLDMWYPGDIAEPYPGERIEEIARRVVTAGHMKVTPGLSVDEMCEGLIELALTFGKNIPLETTDGSYLASAHRTSLGGYLLEFTEVTERLRAERELARQKEISHQNEKLSALGELLAGVAHELNNPLSVVFGYAQMLEGQVDDPKVAERLELIRQSAERAAKIVKTFLAMARQRPTKIELCSLNSAVQTAIEVSSYSLTTNGTVVSLELDESVPPVLGDFDQLAQVFTNLIVNAGHALSPRGDQGRLTVRSFYDDTSKQTVVEVHDNGPGIPKEIQNRIFEPFFTTKDVGEGTGVGLAFSHRILESHGGVLELRSTKTNGTSFFVRIDAAAMDAVAEPSRQEPETADARKSILVVDDEAGVAQLTCDLLSDAGYQVTKSLDPRQALELLDRQSFDVVISDFKMPGLDGAGFFDALQTIAPECADRIGFITGDAMSGNVQAFFERSGCRFIEKPIMRQELLDLAHDLASQTSVLHQ